MSDTCYLQISFPRKDLPKFNEVLKDELYDGVFWDDDVGNEYQVDAIIYEANYGWYKEIEALAKAAEPVLSTAPVCMPATRGKW